MIFGFDSNIDKKIGDFSVFGRNLIEYKNSLLSYKQEWDNAKMSNSGANISSLQTFLNTKDQLHDSGIHLKDYLFGATSKKDYLKEFSDFEKKLQSTGLSAKALMNDTDGMSNKLKTFISVNENANITLPNFKKFLDETSLSAKATKVALSGLAIAGNMLVSIFAAELVSGIIQMSQASSDIANAAKDASSEFVNTSSDIDSYKQKIEELYTTINDSHSSIEQVTDARSQLLSVQDEMIKNFGSEKEIIDDVTEAINGQTSALDKLSSKEWRDILNDFNYSDENNGFWKKLSNSFHGYNNNVDRMKAEYADYTSVFDLGFGRNINGNFENDLRDLGAKLELDDSGNLFIKVNGNATQVYETLKKIQDLADKYDVGDKLKANLGKVAEAAKEVSDKYKDFWDQYVQNEKIFKDSDYSDDYKTLVDDHQKIDDAFENGDTEGREKAVQDYAQHLQDAVDAAIKRGDNDVVDYLVSMYPEIESEVSQWRFKLKFEANTDGIQKSVNDALKTFTEHTTTDENGNVVKDGYTTERLLAFDKRTSNDPALNAAYDTLYKTSQDLGIDFADFVKVLENLGYIVSDAKQQLLNKFPDASDQDRINGLSQDDLNAAYKIDLSTISSVDELVEKIKELKTESENVKPFTKSEMISQINGLSEGFEELDKIMNSMKGTNPFDFSILDDSKFKDTFSGLGEEYENFVEKISNSPKDISGCTDAFNDLVTAWINSTGIVQGLSDETAGLTVAMLSNMGVANAEEVVTDALAAKHDMLAAEKYYNANASDDLANATAAEYVEFLNEADVSDTARVALAQLELSKIAVNNVKIDTASDIDQVIALANAAGASASALSQLARAKAIYAKAESAAASKEQLTSMGDFRQLEEADNIMSKVSSGNFEWNFKIDSNKFKKATYGGGVKSNSPGRSGSGGSGNKGNSSTPKENSTIDWISRSAELLERKSEELKTAISDTWTAYTGLSEEDIKRVQELFSLPVDPNSNEAQELLDYANRLGVSLEELKNLSENNGLESRQSLYQQLMVVDQSRLDQANQSLDYYKQSYEELVSKVPEYRDKIENGGIDIESMTGDQKTNVENAVKAYDSYLDSQKKAKEIQKELREDKGNYYDQVIEQATKENERLSSNNDLIQKQIDLLKARGNIVDASAYETMIGNNKTQISNTKSVIKSRKKKLDVAMDEGLEVGDEEWYELTKSISDAEGELLDLQEKQAEYNKQLKEMPITNMTTVINMYKNISTAIQNWGAELEASGSALTADYYQELIKNGSTIISEYKEQASIIQDVMDTYDVGSDNWNELYSQLQNVNGEMSSMIQNLKKWNEELLQLPLTKISDYSSDLTTVKDALTALQDDYTTVISAVTGAIDDETKAIQDQQKEFQKNIEKQKDAIQDKIDLLDKQNTKLQLQNQLEQALYDLQTANSQKTEAVIRNGEKVFETNTDKIREAQKALQDAQYSKTKNDLQEQLDALNDQLDDYNDKVDDQLEALDKIKDKWSEIAENVTKAQNAMVANNYLGSGWKDKVLSGNDNDIYTAFKNQYEVNAAQIKAYEDQIQSTERIYNLLNSYVEAYKAGTITAAEAQQKIGGLLDQLNKGFISADANLANVLQYTKDVTGASGSSAEQVLSGIKADLKTSGENLIASLKQYEENSKLIGEQTSSWQQLTNNVAEMLEVLKDVKKALKESERDDDDDEDEDDDSSSKKKKHSSKSDGPGKSAWSNKDENNGPGAEINRKKAGIAHDGLEAGVVGSNTANDDEAWMKLMGLKELDPNEYPYVLKAGEQIINDAQRKTVMSNFNNAYSSAYTNGIKRGIAAMSSLGTQVNNTTNNLNVNIEKIMMDNVQDPDGFAKALYNNLELTMAQQRSKFKF